MPIICLVIKVNIFISIFIFAIFFSFLLLFFLIFSEINNKLTLQSGEELRFTRLQCNKITTPKGETNTRSKRPDYPEATIIMVASLFYGEL